MGEIIFFLCIILIVALLFYEPRYKSAPEPYRPPIWEEEKTTIIAPSGKEISITKELRPNKLVIPPEDDAFRR